MGLSGGSKKDNDKKSKEQAEKAAKAVQPKNYYDPFGSMITSGKSSTFTPVESQDQIDSRTKLDASINNIIGQVPTEFDINSYYDNPFYEHTKQMYNRVIDRQRQQQSKELDDALNARGQLGSSYDALRRRDFDQLYADQYAQSDDQARMASANAYQQAYQNLLESLRGLSNERSAQLERTYAPAKIAMGYQNSVAPLQQAAANAYMGLGQYYGGRPTGMDRALDWAKVAVGAGQAAASAYGGG